jgi:hypothetical protein
MTAKKVKGIERKLPAMVKEHGWRWWRNWGCGATCAVA